MNKQYIISGNYNYTSMIAEINFWQAQQLCYQEIEHSARCEWQWKKTIQPCNCWLFPGKANQRNSCGYSSPNPREKITLPHLLDAPSEILVQLV